MVTMMNAAGAAWRRAARTAGSARTTGASWTAKRSRGAGGICGSGATRTAGTAGEGCLEHALQFAGLIGGQFAARDFAGNQAVDLRFDIAGRRTCAAAGAARIAALQRRVDVGQRGRQRTLVARAYGARIDFRLQLRLQQLERRLIVAAGGRGN